MGERLASDIECDGLTPSVIFMVGIYDLDTDAYEYYGPDRVGEALFRLAQADLVVGHNFKKFDAKVIEDLTEGLVVLDHDKIDDTLEIGRALFPRAPNHKLKYYGEIFGYPKGDFKNFDKFSEEMIPYMERDVRLVVLVYRYFLKMIEAMETENGL